ncbi:MAG: hypothetical protein U0441_24770 [Polyangiaceae bacterium]
MILPPEKIANVLGALARGEMACPFCAAEATALFPDERGPRLLTSEGSMEEAEETPGGMTQQVYCGAEDRDFEVLYRPREPLPECPECESDFDVTATPPAGHFKLKFEFVTQAHCESCGEELGPVVYEAFDVRDLGLLGN